MDLDRASPPPLRLVAEGFSTDIPDGQVADENRAAAGLSATDARWVMAIRVSRSIDAGARGLLSPEKRRRLLREGQGLGLRDFDTSLLIAIVQDGVRTGEGLSHNVEQRLGLVRAPERSRDGRSVLMLVAMSLGIAGLWLMLLVRWLG